MGSEATVALTSIFYVDKHSCITSNCLNSGELHVIIHHKLQLYYTKNYLVIYIQAIFEAFM